MIARLDQESNNDYYPSNEIEEPVQQEDTQIQEPITPTPIETESEGFESAGFGIGSSRIDLSIPENEEEMKQSWREISRMKRSPEKEQLKQEWYGKYYNMDEDTYNEEKRKAILNKFQTDLKKGVRHDIEALGTIPMGVADFAMDVGATVIPGFRAVDDKWDQWTKYENRHLQAARDIAGIVVPSLYGGGLVSGGLKSLPAVTTKAGYVGRALTAAGLYAGTDSLIIGLSDQGFDDNLPALMVEWFPGTFGPEGYMAVPEWLKTMDSDSPAVRKLKNMYIDGGLSAVATGIGSVVDFFGNHKTLNWFIPKDEAAKAYKAKEIAKEAPPTKLQRLEELDTQLSDEASALDPEYEQILIDEKITLENELDETMDLEDYFRKEEVRKQREVDTAAVRKTADPEQLELDYEFDPDVSPGILDESTTARDVPPAGQVARNMADVTAIKNGTSKGDPAPLLTESFKTKGLKMEGRSRAAVMGIAEEARSLGDFDAVVDGFRYSRKQMSAAAWDILTTIVDPKVNTKVLKELFLDAKDIKNILNGKIQVGVLNEEQTLGAALGIVELSKQFIGKEVVEASGFAIDTLGKEITTLGEAALELKPVADDARIMDNIIEKLQFLMNEVALNKYISGWQLSNKNFFAQTPPENLDEAVANLLETFTTAEKSIAAKNKRFTDTLKILKEQDSRLLEPLLETFSVTNGDVDTIEKLFKWAEDQLNPFGLIRSPNPKEMNTFTKGVWGVMMNNILSGMSTANAGLSAGFHLSLRPLLDLGGAAIWNIPGGNWQAVQKAAYYNTASFKSFGKSLKFAFDMMAKAHKDPEALMRAARKDLVQVDKRKIKILDKLAAEYKANGNLGKIAQYNTTKLLHNMSLHPALRIGSTGLIFPDQFTNSTATSIISRVRAYDDVFTKYGWEDWSKIIDAEQANYTKAFDTNGLPTDKAARAFSGEINLNLDDATANYINEATTAWPILKTQLMFPRTQTLDIKSAFSWTPVSLIPGANKYAKTIWAKTDDEIAEALAEHGVDFATDPNGRAIFEYLRNHYVGRQAFSIGLVGIMHQWAMGGNIIGNGHYNPAQRRKDRDTFGMQPYTMRIPGTNTWWYYGNIPVLKELLAIQGDLAMYANDVNEPFLENIERKMAAIVSLTFVNNSIFASLRPFMEMLNGNERAAKQAAAQLIRAAAIPLSGAIKISADAVDNSLKDLDGEVGSYIANNIPGFNKMLPTMWNPITDEPTRYEIGTMGLIQQLLPNKLFTHHGGDPEKVAAMNYLKSIGWGGLSRKTTIQGRELTPVEAQVLNRIAGKRKMWKEALRISKLPKFQEQIEALKRHTHSPDNDNERINLAMKDLPPIQMWERYVDQVYAEAELEMLSMPEFAYLNQEILELNVAKEALKIGDVNRAIEIQTQNNIRNLIEMPTGK